MMRGPGPSLKARALQWLAQREHSRLELRRKLLREVRQAHRSSLSTARGAGVARPSDAAAAPHPSAEAGPSAAELARSTAEEVDALLDWLQAERYLSDARFVESRVQARAARFGNRRIQQELQQHGTVLDEATGARLKSTEMPRAHALWQRRFGPGAPADAAARAKQMRFLAGRGFSADVICRVVSGRFEDDEAPVSLGASSGDSRGAPTGE